MPTTSEIRQQFERLHKSLKAQSNRLDSLLVRSANFLKKYGPKLFAEIDRLEAENQGLRNK